MVMDTLAALALATEPPTDDLLKRKPYGRDKSLISITIMKNITGHVIYQLIVSFLLVFKSNTSHYKSKFRYILKIFFFLVEELMNVQSILYTEINVLKAPSLHFSIIFNAFVQMTMFNEINARKIRNERNVFAGVHRNLVFSSIWIFCFIVQVKNKTKNKLQ
jgi:Ca2+ transporting ATPase